MSIDLDWSKLDASLASSLISVLNRQLQSAPRPSFIGPVEVTSFDFGSQPPDIELVDLRDIYRDFLEDDEGGIDVEREPARSTSHDHDEDEGFEWVSRRSAGRGMAEEAPMYHHLPPHVRYGRGPASDIFSPPPSFADAMQTLALEELSVPPLPDEHPNLQLHLLISWHSDMRLALKTSLRINYPSPLFMSLPIRLSVTGLVFNGELAVAYEGGKRIHLCILDDLDPYGPSARRGSGSQGSTPSDPEADDAHAAKRLPVGQRLLPDIFIESELGQADKHVLKNVTRVEKFIQDVIRKTIEEEFVFPNFHTLVLR
ncbi:hypothetical protein B0F90DRAFT_1808317 [Multifurca ochricompacta]|uniref:Mitochondrial distribution and morphology protein 12 n=1 Tax=Multifurca ochricompacta TaxID=376703 RepID=A0AAD4MAV3_9AGAM|nr:hypothetical protein B0F90DRAFT_1808317 [Multifurca ochricompacta]